MLWDYESMGGLIHWGRHSPHGPITSPQPHLWMLLFWEPNLQHMSLTSADEYRVYSITFPLFCLFFSFSFSDSKICLYMLLNIRKWFFIYCHLNHVNANYLLYMFFNIVTLVHLASLSLSQTLIVFDLFSLIYISVYWTIPKKLVFCFLKYCVFHLMSLSWK
jgi:hypothetical protein